jgi:hypothetical protein
MADKLILSRKGFDSKAGGDYSPYNHVTGRYIVLPIPGQKQYPEMKSFDNVRIPEDYLQIGNNADNIRDLLNAKELRINRKTIKLVNDPNNFVHFDPMLGPSPWNNQKEFSVCGYGQAAQAGKLLNNQGVGIGSLFLFFSRFKPVSSSKEYACQPWPDGAYYIYGWMRVGKCARSLKDLKSFKKVAKYHHHAYMFGVWSNNTIYLPAEKLFTDQDIPGCGYFTTLNQSLNLSCSQSQNRPSNWKLPQCFSEQRYRPTYIKNRIQPCPYDNSACCANTAIQGQEFVTELTNGRLDWVKELFDKNRNNIYRP